MKSSPKMTISPCLDVIAEGSERVVKCNQCGFTLCSEGEDWKGSSRVLEEDLYEKLERYRITANPAVDRKLLFREYFCPQCLVALDNDVVESGADR